MSLPPVILQVFAGIYGLLTLASLVCYGLSLRQRDVTELKQRIVSWWVMVSVILASFALGEGFTIATIGVLSYLAFKEFVSIIPTRRTDHRPIFWAYIAIPIQFYWIYIGWYGMFIIFIPLYMMLFIPMRMVLIGNTKQFTVAASTINWLLLLTVFSLGHMAFLIQLPANEGVPSGLGLVLFLLLLTQFNDVAQFTFGKLFGKNKVLATVSPKKTVEGLLGGILATTLLAVLIAPLLTPLNLTYSICAGLLISLFGFIGDVSISAVKRDLGIKDAGSMIPGHGGVLDRVDSLTFTAPLFFHFIRYLHY
ncbi:phosphatidate cytidylyltransferase [Endozoicomonas sp. SM1973]|uniref:Phosphatidate cytidylyltransferase n=1 Tax=Spartinivicinus marinus TaxID=2994442 RepID=A0A853IHB1_9GAMM|nr:phosphatidate cytidylyltransferase [Spartinivicinus marinus]MCX4025903.1 phosphatidate cytidylyltransferase [Spartinivicinus marinus]NYZ68827.1 phosphatidate cytidylyltransferase [Spartinivicinus marinus]